MAEAQGQFGNVKEEGRRKGEGMPLEAVTRRMAKTQLTEMTVCSNEF
jgi:hypothetical protein